MVRREPLNAVTSAVTKTHQLVLTTRRVRPKSDTLLGFALAE